MNKFPTTHVKYVDTYGAGGVTVGGFELTSENGIVEGPAHIGPSIAPHGFYPEGSPRANAFLKAKAEQEKAAKAAKKAT